eukprot:4942928-Pleurochrysis_carterae.AAC.3
MSKRGLLKYTSCKLHQATTSTHGITFDVPPVSKNEKGRGHSLMAWLLNSTCQDHSHLLAGPAHPRLQCHRARSAVSYGRIYAQVASSCSRGPASCER